MAGLTPGRPDRNRRPVGDLFAPFFRIGFLVGALDSPEEIDAFATDNRASEFKIIKFGTKDGATRDALIGDIALKVNASFEATTKAGSPYRFVINMTPEYNDALQLLNSGFIGYATIAKVEWGYLTSDGRNETKTLPHLFRIISPKATFGENIQIRLEGFDIISDVAMRRTKNDPIEPGAGVTPLSIIEGLAQGDPGLGRNVRIGIDREAIPSDHPIFQPIEESITQTRTNWGFIMQLVRSQGLTFVIRAVEDSKTEFYIYNPVKPPRSATTSYTFRWRSELKSHYDIPVYNIDANYLPSMYQPPSARGLLSIVIDDTTGATTVKELDAADTDTSQPTADKSANDDLKSNASGFNLLGPLVFNDELTGTFTSVPAAGSQETGTKVSEPPASEKATTPSQLVDALIKEGMCRSHPIVKVKCPGVVDMYPGLICSLRGASNVFDGEYTVLEVKHAISNSGYDMDVTLIRFVQRGGASGDQPKQDAGTPDGQTPPNPVDRPLEPRGPSS